MYLDNTNILHNLCDACDAGTARETFFFNQMRVNHLVTSSAVSDFEIGGRTFEVGGPNKGQSRIKGTKEGYVVRDSVDTAMTLLLPVVGD